MVNESRTRRARVGRVLTNKMQKTVVVAIERFVPHPMYRKIRRRITKLKAHDEQNQCRVGDRVKIIQTRPLSKDKHWRVVTILQRAEAVEQERIPVAVS